MKKFLYIFGGIVLFVAAAWLSYRQIAGLPHSSGDTQAVTEPAKPKGVSINGVLVAEAVSSRRPLGVVVENHPDARPQSGLASADVVYEAVAEGGITRYLALFQTKDAAAIGPVRSAREYYAEIANDWGSLFAHVGGSPKVLANLDQGVYRNLIDINEYFNAPYFERIKSRTAPHNAYTATKKLSEFLGQKATWDFTTRSLFTFKEDSPVAPNLASATTIPAASIAVPFSVPSFAVRYEYDYAANSYARFVANKKDIDNAAGVQISPKTVIVQVVNVTPVPNDPALRVDIDLTGKGRAIVFMDGQVTEGAWEKTGNGPTVFKDSAGSAIAINRGQVWVELVPHDQAAGLAWQPGTVPVETQAE